MSYNRCCFDRLPAELLHRLFNYFSAHEIFYTFSNVNDHVDAALRSYSSYRLNFQSIQRSDFDIVCNRIHPSEVIFLALSDDNDTPDQSQLFLSHFRIERFTQLRSLTLIQPNLNSLKLILSNLYLLDQLRSLSIETEFTNQIENQLINLYLHHLKLKVCSDDILEFILQHQLQLKSLDVCLTVNKSKFKLNLPTNQLIRLNLKILNNHISMNEIEQILIQLPHLKDFELQTDGSRDLFDGNRWQILTNNFRTFNFHFNASHVLVENILKPFRTSFWLEEKHWFVAYQDYSLFSIPHFAPNYIDISEQPRIHSTAPNTTFLYNYAKKITMTAAAI